MRSANSELELLEEAKRLILEESQNISMRDERRDSVIRAALHDARGAGVLIVTRSDGAADELKTNLAKYLEINVVDLAALGIDVLSVFSPWPTGIYGSSIACGYFGASTVDMLFAGGARQAVLIVDPIEARVAIWDIAKRFCGVPELPDSVKTYFHDVSGMLEAIASPSSAPISLPSLSGDGSRSGTWATTASTYDGKAAYVSLCFTDGSTQESASNARFEVVGRTRLQLQSVLAKDLQIGDQVVLLNDDERAGFSEQLIHAMDEGRFRADRQTRSIWLTMLRAVRNVNKIGVAEIKRRMEKAGVVVDASTIRTWLPTDGSDESGVPDTENVFLAFALAVGIATPAEELRRSFSAINRLRINHRKMGRELVRAIRGAYLGRLEPVTVARMEREWGVEARALLDAARVGTIDDVIPLGGEAA